VLDEAAGMAKTPELRGRHMADTTLTEIPQEIRELAVHNVDQARAAFVQLMDAARKAQEMMKTIIPSNPLVQGLSEVQERAMRFTQQNLDASFSMTQELAKAADLTEALQIQSRHAQLQMHAYALQAQELGALGIAASQKGTTGV
jgi:phasin